MTNLFKYISCRLININTYGECDVYLSSALYSFAEVYNFVTNKSQTLHERCGDFLFVKRNEKITEVWTYLPETEHFIYTATIHT